MTTASGTAVLRLAGTITAIDAGRLTGLVEAALRGPGPVHTVVVDLSGVVAAGPAGLGALVLARHRCADRGVALRLVGVRPDVALALRLHQHDAFRWEPACA